MNRLNAEQLAGAAAGRAVTAWMVTDQIEDLVVLRADRLSAGAWTWVLGLGRETGSRLLLVCHARQIPAHLGAVLAGTGYQLLTGLPQALRGTAARIPGPGQMRQPGPGLTPRTCRVSSTRISATTGARHSTQLGPAGFARTDAVYRHGRDAACHWLSTRPGPGAAAVSGQSVQLFLTWLVHDSPSRHHTLARLRGAQAGFRLHGLMLNIPPSQRLLDVLSGPGLNAPLVTARTAGRIRARGRPPGDRRGHRRRAGHRRAAPGPGEHAVGCAVTRERHPAADLASPQPADWSRPPWQPPRTPATTAVFHVPAAARPLLQAARHFSRSCPRPPRWPGGCSPRHRSATSGSGPRPPTARSRCPLSRSLTGNVADQGHLHPRRIPSEPGSTPASPMIKASTPAPGARRRCPGPAIAITSIGTGTARIALI